MAGQTTYNKAIVPAGTDPWNAVPDWKKMLETAGLVFGVATTAERNALAASAPGGVLPIPTLVRNAETGRWETWKGTRWAQTGLYRLGRAQLDGTVTAPVSGWVDICTIDAVTLGGVCNADFKVVFHNADSGAHRTANFRVTVDGVATDVLVVDAPYRAGSQPKYTAAFDIDSTPAAGAHTWRLQAQADATPAVQVVAGTLTVTEAP